jgi:pyruvate formate lyase activating enzyme
MFQGMLGGISCIDYPGVMSGLVYLSGCNFKCPYCHNWDSVVNSSNRVSAIELSNYLEMLVRNWCRGVVIGGGEPLLTVELKDVIKVCKQFGLLVKLDTNGSISSLLQDVITDVDYVAMDIKGSLDLYLEEFGCKDKSEIKKSIDVIKSSLKEYEFRTTIYSKISLEEIKKISELVGECSRYSLQKVRTVEGLFKEDKEVTLEKVKQFKKILEVSCKQVILKGWD